MGVAALGVGKRNQPHGNHEGHHGIPDAGLRKLALKGATVTSLDERHPLPQMVIDAVYAGLAKSPDLLRIWTLLDFTGARPTEIRTLRIDEFRLSDPVPHIAIKDRTDRTLKTLWSIREVPLVGAALTLAQQIVADATSEYAFPRYADGKGMDRLSAVLQKRIRKHTTDPKHVVYSLRHNVADRLIAADILDATREAIAGRVHVKGAGKGYGSAVPLDKKREAMVKGFAGYRATEESSKCSTMQRLS
jgi:integrase